MRVKLQFYATLIGILGILAGFACKLWFPQYWTNWYIVTLLIYWCMEMIMSFVIAPYEGKMDQTTLDGKKFLKVYMTAKLIKVLATIVFIIAGIAVIGNTDTKEAIVFAGSAVAFYLLNLAVETYAVTKK